MHTAFIRHVFDKSSLKTLWDEQLIAVRFSDCSSTLPENYSGEGKNALNRLWKYCKEGALIGATYRNLYPTKMVLGEILKGSEIQPKKINGYINKTIQLQNTKVIDLFEYPLLLAIQPRHKTTTDWPSAKTFLNALYYGEKLPRDVSSLDPSQLEVLCYEYLRIQNHLNFLLLPIGRTIHDIDIYGENKNRERVFAQVTQSKNKEVIFKKIETLKLFNTNSTRLFFFGPEVFNTTDGVISYQSIEEVFSFMQSEFPAFMDALIGFKF
jgi:hypothetical protein